MASSEGFLTEEQREQLKVASLNADILSSSPKSPPSLLSSDHHFKAPAGGGGRGLTGGAVKHVRRTHSGKLGRAKKGASWSGTLYYDLLLECEIYLMLLCISPLKMCFFVFLSDMLLERMNPC